MDAARSSPLLPVALALASLVTMASAASSAAPIRGVNLGGWLVMEPWITPTLFETANEGVPRAADGSMQVVDEWQWHNVSLVGSHNRTEMIVEHWRRWVTRDHLVALKAAGITHLRIPVGYWYWNYTTDETFAGAASTYPIALELLKTAVNDWAAPLGLSVLLDLHTAPGSQNGFDNSGRRGEVNLLDQSPGPDHGSANTENMRRWEQSVNLLAEWATQHLNSTALFGIEVLNEPFGAWGKMADAIKGTINPQGYKAVRANSADLNVIFQTGFIPVDQQDAYEEPAYHNVWFDDHSYQCFGGTDNERTWNDTNQQVGWAHHLKQSCVHKYDNVSGGVWSFVGEWSLAVTDCAKYLAGGINGGCDMAADKNCTYAPTPVREGHADVCTYYNRPAAELPTDYKAFLLQFARAQMDGFEQSGNGWFFWNFRTENGHAPAWDFLLGVQEGYVDKDVGNRPLFCK